MRDITKSHYSVNESAFLVYKEAKRLGMDEDDSIQYSARYYWDFQSKIQEDVRRIRSRQHDIQNNERKLENYKIKHLTPDEKKQALRDYKKSITRNQYSPEEGALLVYNEAKNLGMNEDDSIRYSFITKMNFQKMEENDVARRESIESEIKVFKQKMDKFHARQIEETEKFQAQIRGVSLDEFRESEKQQSEEKAAANAAVQELRQKNILEKVYKPKRDAWKKSTQGKRMAEDEVYYTYQEFIDYYVKEEKKTEDFAKQKWEEAAIRTLKDELQNATNKRDLDALTTAKDQVHNLGLDMYDLKDEFNEAERVYKELHNQRNSSGGKKKSKRSRPGKKQRKRTNKKISNKKRTNKKRTNKKISNKKISNKKRTNKK